MTLAKIAIVNLSNLLYINMLRIKPFTPMLFMKIKLVVLNDDSDFEQVEKELGFPLFVK
ncbi:hypothetical protein MBO_00210, partial [Moraxella bovoculi 237]